jgi:hypothetical protein
MNCHFCNSLTTNQNYRFCRNCLVEYHNLTFTYFYTQINSTIYQLICRVKINPGIKIMMELYELSKVSYDPQSTKTSILFDDYKLLFEETFEEMPHPSTIQQFIHNLLIFR